MWTFSRQGSTLVAASRSAAGAGGIARVVRLTALSLAASGNSVRVLSALEARGDTIPGIPGRAAGGRRERFVARLALESLGASRVIYDHAGLARAHMPLPGRPFAVWMHGVEVWGKGLTPGRAEALKRADLVLVNSPYTLRRFEAEHWPLPQARVCLLGTEARGEDPVPRRDPASPEAPVALVVGRIDRDEMRKGHLEAVAAWPAVVDRVPGARLVVVGSGDGFGIFRQIVDASPARRSIDILGHVPEEDMPRLWARANVYVQPSRKEGFGIAYAEAMRHGVPVIASVHDAGAHVNVDGETGLNVDLAEGEDRLAEAIVAILSDPARAAAMGAAGRARWRRHFTFESFSRRLLATLADHGRAGGDSAATPARERMPESVG